MQACKRVMFHRSKLVPKRARTEGQLGQMECTARITSHNLDGEFGIVLRKSLSIILNMHHLQVVVMGLGQHPASCRRRVTVSLNARRGEKSSFISKRVSPSCNALVKSRAPPLQL